MIALLAGGALAFFLLAALTVVVVASSAEEDMEPVNVAADLEKVRAMRFTGTFDQDSGATGTLTATKGRLISGDLTTAGKRVKVLAHGANVYLKSSASFWSEDVTAPALEPADAKRWATWPEDFDYGQSGALADLSLTGFSASLRAKSARIGPVQRVKGKRVRAASTRMWTIYVTVSRPHRIVQVKLPATTPIDAAEVPAGQLAAVFTRLREDFKSLAGAVSSTDSPEPKGKPDSSGCGTSGCTVSGTFFIPGEVGDVEGAVIMEAKITADRQGRRKLGTCTKNSGPVESATVRLNCRITSAAWKSFARSASPSGSRYWMEARALLQVVSRADAKDLVADVDKEERGS